MKGGVGRSVKTGIGGNGIGPASCIKEGALESISGSDGCIEAIVEVRCGRSGESGREERESEVLATLLSSMVLPNSACGPRSIAKVGWSGEARSTDISEAPSESARRSTSTGEGCSMAGVPRDGGREFDGAEKTEGAGAVYPCCRRRRATSC